ncbi:Retrovirus-related Pol polyprotein from transposon 17.6, partial [Mucuna pruriens]
MAFITDSGSFCYKVMSFGLKNPRATYQRLMDEIFKDQIGCELEVYVDDIKVELTIENRRCDALAGVFVVLRKHRLKLNPEKCSFGRLLGFMLTRKGIEANIDKCEAVITMRSPQSIKEVLVDGRVRDIHLKVEDDASNRLILTKSVEGIPILIYLSISNEAISVLSPRGSQNAILEDRKGNPSPSDNAQEIMTVIVRTIFSFKQVLRKPDLVGRMVGWMAKLLEFNISFEKKGHVKAQALANFITELAPVGEDEGV